MDQQLVQRIRYLLQTRFRKIRTAHIGNFELVVKQVLDWLENHPVISSLIQHLDNAPGEHHQEIKTIINSKVNGSRYYNLSVKHLPKQEHEPDFKGYTPTTLDQHASACLDILRATIERPEVDFYNLLAVYLTQEDYDFRLKKDPLEAIKEVAVRDFYEYLDEHLDGINVVNGLLHKYKQRVEWFQQGHIRQIASEGYNGKTGERGLAIHLQQYIFDQGIDLIIEPSSMSGEVDLLLRDHSGQYIIIDAKLINKGSSPSEITRKIADGFHQVARYCSDYNQSEGFLAVFINEEISILLDIEQNGPYSFFNIAGHVIYYIPINILHLPSASKSGKARQIHITRDKLVERIF